MMSFILYNELNFYELSKVREYSGYQCYYTVMSGVGIFMGLGQA